MKVFFYSAVVLLVLLAVSSGITKILLMPQDVEFFGKYGFSHPLLIAFGTLQVVGGIFLSVSKTRLIGALIVACSFLVSAVVLVVSGDILLALVTCLFIAVLGFVSRYHSIHVRQQSSPGLSLTK